MKITDIQLRIIQDSRGEDTLEATMTSENLSAISSIPQGKSRGEREATLLPARQALQNASMIRSQILNKEFSSIFDFDQHLIQLDGTLNKSKLGGNLILVLSQAFARLIAKSKQLELWQYLQKELLTLGFNWDGAKQYQAPYFGFNVINGGEHAPYGPKIQEYWIVPQTHNPQDALDIGQKFFDALKQYFQKQYGNNNFGDEGGLLLTDENYQKPLDIFTQIREALGLNNKIKFSLDEAASSFYHSTQNRYFLEKDKELSPQEMLQINQKLIEKYDILSIEDPFEQNDWMNFQKLTKEYVNKVTIIGDDLTVTNPELVKRAGENQTVSGVIIKPTQIGSVSETLKTITLAQKYDLKIVVSHRSGETMDDFIADLAWASQAWGLKSGAPQPPERMAKYNRIIQIYEQKINDQ